MQQNITRQNCLNQIFSIQYPISKIFITANNDLGLVMLGTISLKVGHRYHSSIINNMINSMYLQLKTY